MENYNEFVQKMLVNNGFNCNSHSENEMRFAVKGDNKSLYQSYINRLKKFKPLMDKDAVKRSKITIMNLKENNNLRVY